jgi:type I restriction enzyme R subunit
MTCRQYSNLLADNEEFHKMLVDGVPVEYHKDGNIVGDSVRVCDFENPENNEFIVVNQYTIAQIRRKIYDNTDTG